jgi:hypothetical protein
VADDAQAGRIMAKITAIPGLRPHDFILPNHPSYDDMYEKPEGLWAYGTWVNGGHWSTCEARMVLAYYRLGRFDDARRSMRRLLSFAERFRMDNPLVGCGSDVYQPGQPVNLTYDAFGPPAAFVRGLFEYLYRAEGLTILPHLPPGITRLEQRFPVRFGAKRLHLATVGQGPITAVSVNGQPWTLFDGKSVFLPYDKVPSTAAVEIALGGASPLGFQVPYGQHALPAAPPNDMVWRGLRKTNLAVNRLPLRLGADSNGQNRFRGDFGRARVFSRALSQEEIASLSRKEDGPLLRDGSLVGDWPFAQLANGVVPSTVGARLPAKVVGTVEVVEAHDGKALRLDGSGYLEVAPHPALDLTNACTLEAWVRPAGMPQGSGRLIDKSEVGTSNGYLLDTFPSDSLRFITQAGTLDYAARLAPGQWAHVAATITPDGQLTLYLQGQPVARRAGAATSEIPALLATDARLRRFLRLLSANGLAETCEAAHARLAIDCLAVTHERLSALSLGKLKPLSNPVSQAAADQSYVDTVRKLTQGLVQSISSGGKVGDARKKLIVKVWEQSAAE